MKFGKGAGKYLILAETVVLIIVLVLCTMRYLTRPETTLPVEVAEKENDNELSFESVTEETEIQENTEVPEMNIQRITFWEEVSSVHYFPEHRRRTKRSIRAIFLLLRQEMMLRVRVGSQFLLFMMQHRW